MPRFRPVKRTVSVSVALVSLVLSAGACGEESPEGSASPSSTAAEETSTTAAPTTTTTTEALTEQSKLRMDGIGPIKMGMTLAEASAAVGRPVEIDKGYLFDDGEPNLCAFAYPPLAPGSTLKVGFMVGRDSDADEWRLFRTDIEKDLPTSTEAGIKVGSTEAAVKAAYPSVTVEDHPYTGPEGHYMIVDPDGSGGMLLIFETDGTKVDDFRSGEEGSVQAIEGCS